VDDGGVPAATAHPCLLLSSPDSLSLSLSPSLSLSLSLSDALEESQGPAVGPPRAGWGIAGRSRRQSGGSCVFLLRLGQNAPESTFSGCFSREPFCATVWQGSWLCTRSGATWEPCQTHPQFHTSKTSELTALDHPHSVLLHFLLQNRIFHLTHPYYLTHIIFFILYSYAPIFL
jgi:hypothetical protein